MLQNPTKLFYFEIVYWSRAPAAAAVVAVLLYFRSLSIGHNFSPNWLFSTVSPHNAYCMMIRIVLKCLHTINGIKFILPLSLSPSRQNAAWKCVAQRLFGRCFGHWIPFEYNVNGFSMFIRVCIYSEMYASMIIFSNETKLIWIMHTKKSLHKKLFRCWCQKRAYILHSRVKWNV